MSWKISASAWLLVIGLSASTAGTAVAAEPGITIPGITLLNRQTVNYRCEDGTLLPVTYINTKDQQGFVVIPIDGKNRLFVTLLSGSGARYGSGPYIWWSKGDKATLSNEQDAERPLHGECTSGK